MTPFSGIPLAKAIAFAADLHADSHPPSSRLDTDYIETAVGKLQSIREACIKENVRFLFLGGDIFHRVTTTFECVRRAGAELMKFREAGITVGSIIGNHDLARNQLEKLSKSPLNLLFDFGVLERLDLSRRVIINGKALINPAGYLDKIPGANKKAAYNFLIAHLFYNAPDIYGGKSLSSDMVNALGYDAIFLGHDHINYDIVRVGKTAIVRPGSILRGTSHKYNFERKVGFYILRDPANYSIKNFKFVEIPVKDMREVVSSLVIHKKEDLADLSDLMGDLVVRLTETGGKKDEILETIMKDNKLPVGVRNLLLEYFKEEGILIPS